MFTHMSYIIYTYSMYVCICIIYQIHNILYICTLYILYTYNIYTCALYMYIHIICIIYMYIICVCIYKICVGIYIIYTHTPTHIYFLITGSMESNTFCAALWTNSFAWMFVQFICKYLEPKNQVLFHSSLSKPQPQCVLFDWLFIGKCP